MTVRNGLEVRKVRMINYGGKPWMIVNTKPDGSPPSFEDWFDMIRMLCECEIEKYGGDINSVRDWQRWTTMPRKFFWACFDKEATYETLRDLFDLPDREKKAAV